MLWTSIKPKSKNFRRHAKKSKDRMQVPPLGHENRSAGSRVEDNFPEGSNFQGKGIASDNYLEQGGERH